jgi:uncharacterized damage-inducible protein DinB
MAAAAATAAGGGAASAYVRHIRLMADYHGWAWRRLFTSIRSLPPGEYERDARLYAQSVKGTVHHLLFGDLLWYGRFTGQRLVDGWDAGALAPLGSDASPASAWSACSRLPDAAAAEAEVLAQCERWAALAAATTDGDADAEFAYVSTSGAAMRKHRGSSLLHVFNHGTHHRGQISAAITQAGLPAPGMDLTFYLDELARRG